MYGTCPVCVTEAASRSVCARTSFCDEILMRDTASAATTLVVNKNAHAMLTWRESCHSLDCAAPTTHARYHAPHRTSPNKLRPESRQPPTPRPPRCLPDRLRQPTTILWDPSRLELLSNHPRQCTTPRHRPVSPCPSSRRRRRTRTSNRTRNAPSSAACACVRISNATDVSFAALDEPPPVSQAAHGAASAPSAPRRSILRPSAHELFACIDAGMQC